MAESGGLYQSDGLVFRGQPGRGLPLDGANFQTAGNVQANVMNDHDLLIRHDEQLRQLSKLPSAMETLSDTISRLRTEIKVNRAQLMAVVGVVGIIGSGIGTLGTWYFMLHGH